MGALMYAKGLLKTAIYERDDCFQPAGSDAMAGFMAPATLYVSHSLS